MITIRLRTHPRSLAPVPAKFEFDRPLFSFASTYSRARTPSEEVSVIGRSVGAFSPPPSPTRKKANTFNAPSLARSVPSFLLIVTVKPIFAFWLF